jgi:diadenosine tetraphosphate (Ap4A) HIT family hydrolase
LNSAEFANLKVATTRYERLVTQIFAPTKYNYVISGQQDPDIHLHAVPRYDEASAREFGERPWIDNYWPYFPDFPHTTVPADEWLLDQVTAKLQAGVKRWL